MSSDENLGLAAAHLLMSSTTTESSTNDTLNFTGNETELSRFSRPLLTFAAVMTISIMIVGICGNLLTIIALLKCPKVRNVAAAFIICLCIADCLFCAIVLPFNAFRFIRGTWTHGEILCRVIPFIQYGNVGVSLLCIAMITMNRYIMIAHHSAYARIYKRQWIGAMIAFCWLFSYGMQLPTFFKVWGAFGYDTNLGTCSILKDANGRSSKTALFIIAFVIPCLVIICCYARIFWVVHKSEVRLRRHATKQNSIPNNMRQVPPVSTATSRISSPVSSSSYDATSGVDANKSNMSGGNRSIRVKDQRDVKARRNEWRITKMVLAIFLSFIMCYLPITVIKVADKNVHMPGFHIFGYIMVYLAACINPIIYVIMNKQYRQAYKTVLMCKPTRLLPFSNAGSSVGEKWKDIGYSYNPSRTMVSQISIADYNSNSPQPAMVEHANNNNSNNINQPNWLADIDTNMIPTLAPPHTNTTSNIQNPNNNNISNTNTNTVTENNHQQSDLQHQRSFQQQQRNILRQNMPPTSLIQEDDVILEEDEDEAEEEAEEEAEVEEEEEKKEVLTKMKNNNNNEMDMKRIQEMANMRGRILYNPQRHLKDIPDNTKVDKTNDKF